MSCTRHSRATPPALLALLVLVAGCVDLSHPVGLGQPSDLGGISGAGSAAAGGSAAGGGSPGRGGSGAAGGSDASSGGDGAEPDARATPDGDLPEAAGLPDGAGVEVPIDAPPPPPDVPIVPVPDAGMPEAPPAPLANGASCSAAAQCTSQLCVDGVCCSSACTATCRACNLPGAAGTCTLVPSGEDPRRECPPEAASTCGRMGQCNGQGSCRLHPANTPCGPGACSAGVETSPKICDGLGTCTLTFAKGCGNYLCEGSTCGTSCSTAGQCKSGFTCFASNCVAIGSPPLLLWRFDETTGSTAQDDSGNGYVGTFVGVTGAPATSTQVPSLKFSNPRSRSFNKANRQAVQLANFPAALKPLNNVTVTAWYRATTVDNTSPVQASDIVSAGDQYVIRVRETDIEFAKHTVNRHEKCDGAVSNQLDGNWHHIAGVSSPGGMKIYFDGVEKGSNTIGDPIFYDRGSDFFVGRHGNGQDTWDFEGNIDEVRVYARALSAAEIAALAAGDN